MATFNEVKASIDENITANGDGKITGGILNGVLNDMVEATEEGLNEKANKSDISEDVYIGETEPTDKKVKVWINPNEEANTIQARTTSGGGTSGGITRVWVGVSDIQLTDRQVNDNKAAYANILNGEPIDFVNIIMDVNYYGNPLIIAYGVEEGVVYIVITHISFDGDGNATGSPFTIMLDASGTTAVLE